MSDSMLNQAGSAPASVPAPASAAPVHTPLANAALTAATANAAKTPAPANAAPAAPSANAAPAVPKPQSYTDFVVPEGARADGKMSGEFKALAQELGLNQEGAQKLVDLYASTHRQWGETQSQWQNQAKTDREYGGIHLTKSIATAAKAIDAFGGKDLRAALEQTGAGNHPEVIRFFYRVGKSISEDGLVSARSAAASRSPAEIMYPNLPRE